MIMTAAASLAHGDRVLRLSAYDHGGLGLRVSAAPGPGSRPGGGPTSARCRIGPSAPAAARTVTFQVTSPTRQVGGWRASFFIFRKCPSFPVIKVYNEPYNCNFLMAKRTRAKLMRQTCKELNFGM